MTRWLLRFALRGAGAGLCMVTISILVAARALYARAGLPGVGRLFASNKADQELLSILLPAEFIAAYVVLALYEIGKRADAAVRTWWHDRRDT
jgi:hypothetical protein